MMTAVWSRRRIMMRADHRRLAGSAAELSRLTELKADQGCCSAESVVSSRLRTVMKADLRLLAGSAAGLIRLTELRADHQAAVLLFSSSLKWSFSSLMYLLIQDYRCSSEEQVPGRREWSLPA